jgi:hypothetical protein
MTNNSDKRAERHQLQIADEGKLADVQDLEDLPAGEYFAADLEEARALAQHEPRFECLVDGLQAATMGERVAAITACFDQFSAAEIANLTLPPHLSQLREIYLSSRSDWP